MPTRVREDRSKKRSKRDNRPGFRNSTESKKQELAKRRLQTSSRKGPISDQDFTQIVERSLSKSNEELSQEIQELKQIAVYRGKRKKAKVPIVDMTDKVPEYDIIPVQTDLAKIHEGKYSHMADFHRAIKNVKPGALRRIAAVPIDDLLLGKSRGNQLVGQAVASIDPEKVIKSLPASLSNISLSNLILLSAAIDKKAKGIDSSESLPSKKLQDILFSFSQMNLKDQREMIATINQAIVAKNYKINTPSVKSKKEYLELIAGEDL